MIDNYIQLVKDLMLFEHGQFYSVQTKQSYFSVKKDNKYVEVTIPEISKHFNGTQTISIQPIQYQTNLCKYGAIDFDTNNCTKEGLELLLKDVMKVATYASSLNLPHYIEFSGRKGFHIYFFVNKPVDAKIMRNFLRYICNSTGYHTDELYPNGDYISHTYYPKPLKLFYGIHQKTGYRSGFFDVKNIIFHGNSIDVSDTINILSNVKFMDQETLLKYQAPLEYKTYINAPLDWSKIPFHHPACISNLLKNGACYETDYNKNNLTLARYVADRSRYLPKMDEKYLYGLAALMAKNTLNHPTSKISLEEKLANMNSIINSNVWKNYKWKCSFVWTVKSQAKSCAFCPLNPKAYGVKDTNMLPLEDETATAVTEAPLLTANTLPVTSSIPQHSVLYKTACDDSLLSETCLLCLEFFEDKLLVYTSEAYLLDYTEISKIAHLLENRDILKISSNMIKVCNVLYLLGIDVFSYFDILLAYNLTHAGLGFTSKIDDVALFLTGLLPEGNLDTLGRLVYYMQHYTVFREELIEHIHEKGLIQCYSTELAHVKVSSEIESTGLLFDTERFYEIKKNLEQERDFLISKLRHFTLPYDDEHALLSWLKEQGYTYSDLDSKHLSQMNLPEVNLFIRYKKALYNLSRCSNNILSYIKPSGRLKTNVNQLGTVTGRVTTSEYSTVNIPKGGLRECFVSQPNYLLLDVDFSMQELVINADMCSEPLIIQAISNDVDIHSYVASLILDKDITLITSIERNLAKAFVYGFSYGVGEKRVQEDLRSTYGIIKSNEEIKELKSKFFSVFVKIKERLDYISKTYPSLKCLSSPSERKRFYKDSSQITFNTAVNNPIQMCAADIMKIAASNIYYYIKHQKYRAFFVNEVYDQLTLEVHKEDIEDVSFLVEQEMRKAARLFLHHIYMDVSSSICSRLSESK